MSEHSFNSNSFINKSILDKEILRFTLSLYNNPLLSRKAVDFVIQQFSNYTDNILIPFLQNEIQTKLQNVLDPLSYSKVKFVFQENKNIFRNYLTEHNRFQIYTQKSYYTPPQSFEIET